MSTQDQSTVRAALAELVALKDLKLRFSYDGGAGLTWRNFEAKADYEHRKPLAWAAARAALTTQAPAEPAEPLGRCCYGGQKPKRACASCAAWVAAPTPVEPGDPANPSVDPISTLRPIP